MRQPKIVRGLVAACLLLGVAGAGGLVGCRRGASDKKADELKQSLAELNKRLDELKKSFMALREQVETVPPDMPGFSDVRIRFYATEEGRGTTDAKKMWLASQLEAAAKSGHRAELDQVAKEIALTYEDIRKIEELHVKLLHQVMAFQRMARQAQPSKPNP